MINSIEILSIFPESFRANRYTLEPFRMIGLIDVNIKYFNETERVTLAFYRSSGTNSGKTEGLWYPIVGIKTHSGKFTEFSPYTNYVLTITTNQGEAKDGWLAKSLFFGSISHPNIKNRGFSNGKHHNSLLFIGAALRSLYEQDLYYYDNTLNASSLNQVVFSKAFFQNNKHSQRENYERLIEDIFVLDF